MDDADEDEPITVLGRLQLPRPSRVEDVVTDIGRWVRDHIPNETHRYFLTNLISQPLTRRQHTLLDFLSIIQADPGTWPGTPSLASLVRTVKTITAELSPADTVIAFLESRAHAYVFESVENLLWDTAGVQRFLADSDMLVSADGTVSVGFEVTLPIGRLLEAYGDSGIALYDLRCRMEGDLNAFDEALAKYGTSLAPGVERGLVRIFDGAEADPLNYVMTLGPVLPKAKALSVILGEMERRSGLNDGFREGPDAEEWLRVISGLAPWRAQDVESLLRLEGMFRWSPDAFLKAVMSGVLSVSPERPSIAVFAALTLLRLARRQRLAKRGISDADTERTVAHAIRHLWQGEAILGLDGLLSELPADIPGESTVWPYLGKGEKGVWERRVRKATGESMDLREGACMFLFASASCETYADVYRLVIGLLETDRALDFLRSLVPSRNALVALRAEHLVRELPYAIPG